MPAARVAATAALLAAARPPPTPGRVAYAPSMKIGELLPADDELARWLLVLTLARNDVALTRDRVTAALKDEDGTALHWARLLGGHLFEIAQFLRRSAQRTAVLAFVKDELPGKGRGVYNELLTPEFLRKVLGDDRNLVFHYPSTDTMDHRGGPALLLGLQAVSDLDADFTVRWDDKGRAEDVRFRFADEVAVQFALTTYGSTPEEQKAAVAKVKNLAAMVVYVADCAFHTYCENRGFEYGEPQPIPNADADDAGA